MRVDNLRKLTAILMTAFCSMLLPGCFDLTEVDDINIVTALGIDQIDNGLVRLTAQLVNPANVPAAGGGGGATPTVQPFSVREETGNSLEEALEKFKFDLPHELYLAHNSLIVFGSAYAKEGLDRAMDFLERQRDLRRTELFVVTPGTAWDVLSAQTDPEPLNAFGIRALVEQSGRMFELADSTQLKVMKEYLSPSQAPVLALVGLDPLDHPVMKGVAMFRGTKFTDVLTMNETKALAWLVGDTRQLEIHLPCDAPKGGVGTTVRLLESHTDVAPQFRNNRVNFQVTVNARGEIVRLCPNERLSEKTYKQLENKFAKQMEREMQAVVAKLQSDGVDACQYGTRLFMKDPKRWRKISQRWPESFASAEVKCNVRVQILRSDLSSSTPESAVSRSGLPPQAGRGVTTP